MNAPPRNKLTLAASSLALLAAFGLTACKSGPTPGGNNHQWLSTPGSLNPSDSPEIQVKVDPKDDDASGLISALVEDVLGQRGYKASDTSGKPFLCYIDYSGAPESSSVGSHALLRDRWQESGSPSCIVVLHLRLNRRSKPPMVAVLWTDSGVEDPVLTRTGHVRGTAAAEPGDLMLEPAIARGLREVLHRIFPKGNS